MRTALFSLVICVLAACAGSTGSADLSTIPRYLTETFPVALAEPTEVDFTPSGDASKVPYRAPILVSRTGCTVLYDGPVSLGRALVLHDRSSGATVLIVRKVGTSHVVTEAVNLARHTLVIDGMLVPPFELSENGHVIRILYEGVRDGESVRGIVTARMDFKGTTLLLLAMEYPAVRQESAPRVYLRYATALGLQE
jgi:hypothetical protein